MSQSKFDLLKFSDCVLIVPAFNEANQIGQTLTELLRHFSKIIVVDDGSTDKTALIVKGLPVSYLRHEVNLGQGAAIQTGVTYALKDLKHKFFITFDADGQHSVDSALNLLALARAGHFDVILGSRFLTNESNVPALKKIILKLAVIFTRLNSGLRVTDTHNGIRIFNRNFASKLDITQNGMAHASQILLQIAQHKVKWTEFPVSIKYTKYSKLKGQSSLNFINIITELLHK